MVLIVVPTIFLEKSNSIQALYYVTARVSSQNDFFPQDEILYKFASGILYFNVGTHSNPKQVFPEQENIHEDSG